jgi:hypothetical protein
LSPPSAAEQLLVPIRVIADTAADAWPTAEAGAGISFGFETAVPAFARGGGRSCTVLTSGWGFRTWIALSRRMSVFGQRRMANDTLGFDRGPFWLRSPGAFSACSVTIPQAVADASVQVGRMSTDSGRSTGQIRKSADLLDRNVC